MNEKFGETVNIIEISMGVLQIWSPPPTTGDLSSADFRVRVFVDRLERIQKTKIRFPLRTYRNCSALSYSFQDS
jgi:hypothetical protein